MELGWDDLKLFLAVARFGGLSAAAAATGASPATLGRRMAAVEAALGRPLFIRSPRGYRLTETGEELLERAAAVEEAMVGLERWREGAVGRRVVRVSAGTWTALFLAEHVKTLWRPDDPFALEWVTATARVDIGRRAADIGLRNARPTERWLAGRRIGRTAFAFYRGRAVDAEVDAVLGVSGDSAAAASARWLAARFGDTVRLSGNDPTSVRELAAAGAGRALLPCFVGDRDPRLARVGAPIAELTSEQWLVTHHEGRHEPAVRTVAERIVRLMRAHAMLWTGDSPAERPGQHAAQGSAISATNQLPGNGSPTTGSP